MRHHFFYATIEVTDAISKLLYLVGLNFSLLHFWWQFSCELARKADIIAIINKHSPFYSITAIKASIFNILECIVRTLADCFLFL